MPKEITNWGEIVGNDSKKEMIINAVSRNVLPPFILFTGNSGIGKSTFAKITAKTILCEHRDELGEPCGTCESCLGIENGTSESYKKINMPTLFKKTEINDKITEIFKIKKISNKTVYVLEEIHGLSEELQAMLLEELTKIPKDVWIISCTTRQYKLLPEILNRALEVKLLNPTERECIRYASKLAKEYGIDVLSQSAIRMLVEKCDYNPRKIGEVIRVVATDNKLTEDTISKLFENVSEEAIVDYLNALFLESDVYKFMTTMASLQNEVNMYQLNKQAIDYMFEYIVSKSGRTDIYSTHIPSSLIYVLEQAFSQVSSQNLIQIMAAFGESGIKDNEAKNSQRLKLTSAKAKIERIIGRNSGKEIQTNSTNRVEQKSENNQKLKSIETTNEFSNEFRTISAPSQLESLFVETGFGDEV